MDNFSLGTRYGVNNILVPRGGPATIPASLNFTNASIIEIDGEQVVSTGKIEYLQGVFIDNADYTDTLTLTMGLTGQRIICPPKSQGYFAIMAPNPPKIIASSPQNGAKIIPVLFYNVPIQSAVWSVI